ncbi:pentatricopeptide repeat-containing protein At5g06540-like [Nymphaea colorata]|uniref:Pentacotripeptide-repeat region of PRORP domain-containing protein n=1 Tax=Nymphaea colorata TaxID=210225 RepID=A0A5K1B7F0_9MAGN|nr:pentatricopeptide repeat-containing protein At5g06540-like [Nymphaea colorata]XP_031478865.1 pentatricopeptide repeat-containing protein At5g06540-like [Nymphaea colorata]
MVLALHGVEQTLVSLLQSWCTNLYVLKPIHARVFRHQLHHPTTLIASKLLTFCAISPRGDIHYARLIFRLLEDPNIFFYNIMIRGYAVSKHPAEAMSIFKLMKQKSVSPDGFTFPFLLKACSRMSSTVSEGESIHVQVIKCGFQSYLYVQNGLLHSYAGKGVISSVHKLFDEMRDPDVVSWSALVLGYVKVNDIESARQIFDKMPHRDVVSWTAMINGYARLRFAKEALELFYQMQSTGIKPDEVTMISVISSCSCKGDLELGLGLHKYIEDNGFGWMISLCNALIDMYAKCGCIERAQLVFERMPHRSLITWNSMISALAVHGRSRDALALFEKMKGVGVRPDGVTFLAVLCACTHNGSVDKGQQYFESMKKDYCIDAGIEHYGCMVDLLGRAGLLDEAYRLVVGMPIPCNDKVWGALLGACKIHGNAQMAEDVLRRLILLKPDEGGYYVLLANLYIEMERRADAMKVRQEMKARGAKKNAGFSSWIG